MLPGDTARPSPARYPGHTRQVTNNPVPSDLPPALRAFLYICIDSTTQLELIVRLRHLGKAATVRELSVNANTTAASIRPDLDTLTARGLLSAQVDREVTYRYAPSTEQFREGAESLVAYYSTHREAVIRLFPPVHPGHFLTRSS